MIIRVLFFGILKDLAGRPSESLNLAEGASAGSVLDHYEHQFPANKGLFSSIAISVNQQYARREDLLRPGDEVALLPPVSGGFSTDNASIDKPAIGDPAIDDPAIGDSPVDDPPIDDPPVDEPRVKLVRERIVAHEIVPALEQPEDGAIVIFDGIVRNHSRGRRTLYLDYEAYESMAVQQLNRLAAEAKERFAIRNVSIVHRLGRIEIGQSSVLIAVFSAHRAPAFEACRWLIDTLKRTVPIWKKEYFEDGAVWADGEPFPDELTGANHDDRASN